MRTVRRSSERGHAEHGWLDSRHTFSFGEYYDPRHMGFRALRVINEDRVAPGAGFGPHGHRDMEILTWILDGALAHRDSLGNGSVIRPGDAQRMSAGTGVRHSEMNASEREPVHLLQIWIEPERTGVPPGYEERHFPVAERRGRLRLVASRDGRDGSVAMHQDARVYAALLEPGERLVQALEPGRHAWLHVARGRVECDGFALEAGDALAVSAEPALEIAAGGAAELLLFDLA